MSIEARAKLLITELKVSQSELERLSHISKQVWSNAFRGKQRMNSSHIEFLCSQFPDYSHWLVTGASAYGRVPQDSGALEYFELKAKVFAKAYSEFFYVREVVEFANGSTADDESAKPSSPTPVSRQKNEENVLTRLLGQTFSDLAASIRNAMDKTEAIDDFFKEQAIEQLSVTQDTFGRNSHMAIICSRFFAELLLPGSRSNILNAEGLEDIALLGDPPKQNPNSGVDAAYFDND